MAATDETPRPGPGGRRAGAGRPPVDLYAVCDYRTMPDGSRQPVTYMERIVETMRLGGFLHDAAARIGIETGTIRSWRKQGARAIADVAEGRKRRSHLTKKERQRAEMAALMDEAETEARLNLLALAAKTAQGGHKRTETTTKHVAAAGGLPALVETTQREIVEAPNPGMIQWLLGHRWPEDFNRQRVEVTGKEGGPINIDAAGSALDRLRAAVEGSQNGQRPPATPAEPAPPATS